MDILFLVIAAVISGVEGWEAIETFGKEKLRWLREYFPCANGVPSHDCIRMVMISLSPKGLQACFARWVQEKNGSSFHSLKMVNCIPLNSRL